MKLEKNTVSASITTQTSASSKPKKSSGMNSGLTPQELQLVDRFFRTTKPTSRAVSSSAMSTKALNALAEAVGQPNVARLNQLFGANQLKPQLADIAHSFQAVAKRLAR